MLFPSLVGLSDEESTVYEQYAQHRPMFCSASISGIAHLNIALLRRRTGKDDHCSPLLTTDCGLSPTRHVGESFLHR